MWYSEQPVAQMSNNVIRPRLICHLRKPSRVRTPPVLSACLKPLAAPHFQLLTCPLLERIDSRAEFTQF